MIVKAKASEITLSSTANTVDSATCVRIYNSQATNASVITNTTESTSFTLPAGAITFVQKAASDTLTASQDVKAVSVAFNIS